MLILAAIFAVFIYGMIAALLGSILPDLSSRFQLKPQQNGWIAFSQALGLILASISVGPLLDSEGKKVGLVLGLALAGAALALLARSTGFRSVATHIFLLGLGGGLIVTASNALGSDVAPERRAAALSLLNLFFGLGGLATPLIAAQLKSATRLSYLTAGLAGAALILSLATPMPRPEGASSFVFADAIALFGTQVLWLGAALNFLYVACEVAVWNWLVQHLIAQGIPQSKALNVLSLGFALGLLSGRLAAARVLISVPGLMVLVIAPIAMAILTYLVLQARAPALAWILTFLTGVAMAPMFPTTLAVVADASPRGTSTAIGIVITSGWIGLAVSSSIIGKIAGADNRRLKQALLVLPAMSILMFGVALALHAALR